MNPINNNRQNGATLFIGLILLLAISIVSLAAMRTSVLDLTLANNKQQLTYTFEASENVMNTRLADLQIKIFGTEVSNQLVAGTTESTQVFTKNKSGQNVLTANVASDIKYRNQGGGTGWELNGAAYHFQMDIESSAPARGANSNHRIGFFVAAPSAN